MAKILIVDADESSASLLARVLRGEGHQCRIEASAGAALEIAERTRPDMFVVDATIPPRGGFELCRQIRRHDLLYTKPVLLLSPMGDRQEVEHGLAQGADDYVIKPAYPMDIQTRIGALLQDAATCLAPDALTGLPNAKRIRRDLQRRICRSSPFAVVYVELLRLRELVRSYGVQARDKAIVLTARTFAERLSQIDGEKWVLGHMGGGHFVCILAPGEASFCRERLRRLCQERFEPFYASLGGAPPSGSMPKLDVLLCMTRREEKVPTSPERIFDVLVQLRQKAMNTPGGGGVHVDARKPAPPLRIPGF